MDKSPEGSRKRWSTLKQMSPQQLEAIKEILVSNDEYQVLEDIKNEYPSLRNRTQTNIKEIKEELAISQFQ